MHCAVVLREHAKSVPTFIHVIAYPHHVTVLHSDEHPLAGSDTDVLVRVVRHQMASWTAEAVGADARRPPPRSLGDVTAAIIPAVSVSWWAPLWCPATLWPALEGLFALPCRPH